MPGASAGRLSDENVGGALSALHVWLLALGIDYVVDYDGEVFVIERNP